MKWFNRWLYNKMKDYADNQANYERDAKVGAMLKQNAVQAITLNHISTDHQIASSQTAGRLDTYPDLNFQMFRAENGYVMQVRHQDRKTDRNSINLHVITEEQDLGTAIAHIITIESLKVN